MGQPRGKIRCRGIDIDNFTAQRRLSRTFDLINERVTGAREIILKRSEIDVAADLHLKGAGRECLGRRQTLQWGFGAGQQDQGRSMRRMAIPAVDQAVEHRHASSHRLGRG
jgi:hypothetical protein